MTSPRSHKCLTILEEKKIIDIAESGGTKKDIAKQFGILPSTLSNILKNKDRTLGLNVSDGKKRFRKCKFPQLEECLVKWFAQCREKNIPMSGAMLKEKALSFALSLGIVGFSASEGWLANFKKRHDIVYKKLCGESASVDESVCSNWKIDLKGLLDNYEPRNIFNTDETGLFFKCLPEKTLNFQSEKCHGGKHSKQRVTLLLAANMDGSEKLKPLIIGKSAKPRCFKGVESFPVDYKANKKSWMTTELFNTWLLQLKKSMKKQKRKILLFMDNCTVHNNPPPLDHIKVHFFPPNTTSKLQPLDQGVIQNFLSQRSSKTGIGQN